MSTYIYEDLQPKIERRNTPESHLLLVHIPDGFTRIDVGAKVEYDFGRVRVFGERSIGNFKRSRFNQIYQVPSYCNTSNIKGKIDGNIITISMPIIRGSKVPTQQELDEEEEEAAKQKQKQKEHEESISQKGQQEKEENSAQKEVTKVESKREADHENSATPEVNKGSMSQKDQQKEESSSIKESQVTKVESEKKGDQHDHETSTPSEEASKDSMSQKGKQEKEASPQSATQVTEVEGKKKDDHKTSTPPEANKDSMSQKGNEGIVSAKDTFTTDAKLQTEEENTEGQNDHERKSVGKEESKEDQLKKIITEKVKEIKEESKVSADKVEGVIRKNTEKVKGKFGDDAEKISDKRGIYESTRTRIKDMADSTSQAVTRLAKRSNNEENKQKIIYTAAATLVVGISVYASFKYRSSRRP